MGWFIAQSLAFIIIAALIGLAIGIWIGWIVWGRRAKGKHTAEKAEAARAGKSGATAADAAAAGTTGSDAATGETAEAPAEADRGAVHALAVATADEEHAAGEPGAAAQDSGKPDGEDGLPASEGSTPDGDALAGGEQDAAPAEGQQDGASAEGRQDSASAESRQDSASDGGTADGVAAAGGTGAEGSDAEADIAGAEADVVAAAEAVAREAAEADAAAAPQDDLKRIEGIGPKIAAALAAAGYGTYARIAAASETELRAAVASQGIKFAPSATTWADQAQYLADGDEDGLQEYQDYLIGGQERRAKFNEDVDYADVDEIEGAEAKAEAIAQDEAETVEAEAADAEAAATKAGDAPETEALEASASEAAAPEATAPEAEAPSADAEVVSEPEPQDLQRIEGIGPKIEAALKAAGYGTYAKIAAATEAELRAALAAAGIKFAPAATSWADQAQYLVDGDEDGLREYQDYLIGGQERRAKFNEDVDYADVDEIEGAEAKAAAIAQDEAETVEAEAAEADAVAAKAETAPEPEPEPEPEPQDLQRIEGIGPKIEAALKAAGYTTYAKVAAASETELRAALAAAGIKFAPAATSWADQAQYLVDGDDEGLREYQDYLVGGQERRAKFNEDVDYADVDEIEGAEAKAEAIAQDEAETAAAEAETAAAAEAAGDAEPTQSGVKA